MQIINLTYPITQTFNSKCILCLGFFDGVHLGHQHLIQQGQKLAKQKNMPLMVMTFDRHPKEVYANETNFSYLETLTEKADKLARLGVDYLAVLPFTKAFSQLSPQDFVETVLLKLNPDTIVAGFDYTYGPKDVANMQNLPTFAQNRFEILTVGKQEVAGTKIGSSQIRQAIQAGEMELVTHLLGEPYTLSGEVIHGLQNGHKIGFPTANLQVPVNKVIPKIGVYATKTLIDGTWYQSMTSVGYNVTINEQNQLFIESNLFDFNEDVYGLPMTIAFYHYTRPELKFDGLDSLMKQLQQDEREIRAYFSRQTDQ